MRRYSIVLSVVLSVMFNLSSLSASESGIGNLIWKDMSNGITDPDMKVIATTNDTVYVASSDVVYRLEGSNGRWSEIVSFRGTGNRINAIAVPANAPDTVYVGTDNGLYRNAGKVTRPEKIFKGIGESAGSILSIALHPTDRSFILIGSRAGVYISSTGGDEWKRGRNIPSNSAAVSVAIDPFNPGIAYAASGRGIYRSITGGTEWKRIYEAHSLMDKDLIMEGDDINEKDDYFPEPIISSIAVDRKERGRIFAGTRKGLLISDDGGMTWTKASSIGLTSLKISSISISDSDPDSLFASTDRGVFRYSMLTDSWDDIYRGLPSTAIRYIASAKVRGKNKPTIWAVTKRGIFRTEPSTNDGYDERYAEQDRLMNMFDHEPGVQEIREAAIEYAEVSPEKIRSWRRLAEKKAWLPDLKIAYDKNRDWQSSSYFSSGKYAGDDITKDRDSGWEISLNWELGDLIWNSAQTSIDSRSKLMVQLRDDILNEVTGLYYERRRLQYEMALSPPRNIREKIERELRLKELTAGIDSLTGSYLSKRLGVN